jgi:hypothetical protein
MAVTDSPGWALLERVLSVGRDHELPGREFETLARTLYAGQPAEVSAALRTRRLEFGKFQVRCEGRKRRRASSD